MLGKCHILTLIKPAKTSAQSELRVVCCRADVTFINENVKLIILAQNIFIKIPVVGRRWTAGNGAGRHLALLSRHV